jgi:tetratricopeptide (TPR) repeat protein
MINTATPSVTPRTEIKVMIETNVRLGRKYRSAKSNSNGKRDMQGGYCSSGRVSTDSPDGFCNSVVWPCNFRRFFYGSFRTLTMITRAGFRSLQAGFFVCLLLAFSTSQAWTAETSNSVATTPTVKEDSSISQDALRSYLQVQEQLRNTQLALEQNRQEAEAAATRNAQMIEGRLSLIEKSMASQRLEELKDLQHSNRLILIAAGVFAVISFLVLLFTAFLQWSAVNRLAGVTAAFPASRALASGPTPAALGMGDGSMGQTGALQESTARFLAGMEGLEKRIRGMEESFQAGAHLEDASSNGNGHGKSKLSEADAPEIREGPSDSPVSEQATKITMLLGKGQTLLKLDQLEAALACFNEALEQDPNHTEAWVKKGAVLERLQRLDEAVACYDRAIAADGSLTMAYLHKGGVFNLMERYGEALECYEKALQTQEKSHAV